MFRYIVIEGPIGVGKTSLAKLLAKEFNARCILEKAEDNPFLSYFYEDRIKICLSNSDLFFTQSFPTAERDCSTRPIQPNHPL